MTDARSKLKRRAKRLAKRRQVLENHYLTWLIENEEQGLRPNRAERRQEWGRWFGRG